MDSLSIATAVLACLVVGTQCAVLPASTSSGVRDICHGLQCPKFTVLNKTEDWELRHYGPTKWVATNASAMNKDDVNSGMFQKLFQYISGENTGKTKIDMTAPVVTKVIHGQGPNCESEFVMHFMLPFAYWDSPIQPTNPTVRIQELPAMDVFVRSFGGFAKDADYLMNLHELSEDLGSMKISLEDAFFYEAGYDGPYTFFNRHNEVWIQRV